MAFAETIRFGDRSITISDGEASPSFVAPCGVTQFTNTTNVETNTVTVPDCADLNKPGQVVTSEISRAKSFSFSGLLSKKAFPFWREWDDAGGEREIEDEWNLPLADGGGKYEGTALLTGFEITGDFGNRYQVSGTITWVTNPTWTDAAE